MKYVAVSFSVVYHPRRKRPHGRRGARGFHPEKVVRYYNHVGKIAVTASDREGEVTE